MDNPELEYTVMDIISRAAEPVGSSALARELERVGHNVSEATAGRLLRNLDERGLTERFGFRGRRLTPLGHARREELMVTLEQISYGNELLNALKSTDRKELVDVLITRRAVEGESARLAAVHASPAEIQQMLSLIEHHRQTASRGLASSDDVEFHRLVALASRNRVLLAVLDLIRRDGLQAPVLEFIRKEVGSRVVSDHTTVYQAIAARDPEGAKTAMIQHIDNVIRDVERYWAKVSE
jgi:GntR family L-lactate dehydrogenase operon transcriptional regulator